MPSGRVTEEPPSAGALLPLRRPVRHAGASNRRLQDVDEWGRSERARALLRRLYGPVYRHWFRAEWEGLEKIPATAAPCWSPTTPGRCPSDAPVIMHGIEEELGRPVYGLADDLFRSIPVVGTAWARGGGVAAHPDNAYRLLRDQQQLVLVFPEGTKGTSKPFSERYQLRRFGRGGFVEIAMRAGVPVVPDHRHRQRGGDADRWPASPRLAKRLGVPYVPRHRQHAVCWARSGWSASSRPRSSCGSSIR